MFPYVTTGLALLAIGLTCWIGLQRGMDKALSFGPQSEENAIAVAISELVYGLDGYLTHYKVLEALEEPISRGASGANDPRIQPNLRNGALINEGIENATRLGSLAPVFVFDGGLRTMVYDDVGIVDFMKVAFATFGFRIESLYFLFFAALTLSTLAFSLQFWGRPLAQVLMVCSVSAFIIELQSRVFSVDMPTFWGMRHGSTLALVPTLHLALLLIYRCRLNLVALALAALQVAILVLAMKMRGTALWAVLFLAGLTLLLAWSTWRRSADERSLPSLARLAVKWPFVLVLAGIAANWLYTSSKLHPVYFTDDVLPYHGAWHSAFLGLNTSPDFWPLTGVVDGAAAHADSLGYKAALAYLKERKFIHLEQDYLSPWTKTFKMRLHDNIMRRVFFGLVAGHPKETIALYLYWKPIQIWAVFTNVVERVPVEAWLVALLGATLLAGLLVVAFPAIGAREFRAPFMTVLGAFVVSFLPNMWAYGSAHTISDSLLLVFILATFGGCWAAAAAMLRWRARIPQGRVA
ncbi:hypothetical protein [Reyranella sp.]|uniref:hypothetical protein n=1 Tax=Reyranella sp. TaxID=1929291 RepID=UPI003BAD49A9